MYTLTYLTINVFSIPNTLILQFEERVSFNEKQKQRCHKTSMHNFPPHIGSKFEGKQRVPSSRGHIIVHIHNI